MTGYIGASFSKAFYAQDLARTAASSSAPSSPGTQAASKPVFFNDPSHGRKPLSELKHVEGFSECQQQYTALLDRLAGFVDDNASRMRPPLTEGTVRDIKTHIDVLKNHLIDEGADHFGDHKPVIFGSAKEMFHKLDDLLANSRLPLERRMAAVQALAPSLGTCSGGVVTAVQNAVSELHVNTAGMKGTAYRAKLEMMEALIQEHVRKTHRNIQPGNEVHFVNAYFNRIAPEMGVPEREDPFIGIGNSAIDEEKVNQCKTAVFAKMKPTALAGVLADTYLNSIKDSLSSAKIHAEGVLNVADLAKANGIIDDVKLATLDRDFGEVPTGDFVTPADDTFEKFEIARHPMALVEHFMAEMKRNELVDYNGVFKLTLNDGRGDLVVLDNLIWRDKDGQCMPVDAADLLKISPEDIACAMATEQKTTAPERDLALRSMITEILHGVQSQSTTEWIGQCASQLQHIGPEDEKWAGPALRMASYIGNVDVVEKMVAAGAPVNMRDRNGRTAAMVAAQKGDVAVLRVLVKADPDTVNVKNKGGRTAAMLAALQGHAEALKVLVKADPSTVQVVDNGGHTAVIHAAGKGHAEALKVLISADKNTINIQDKDGSTAVMFAVHNGHIEALKVLIDADENSVNIRNLGGCTAAMGACWLNRVEALKVLVEASPQTVNHQDKTGRTAAMYAAEKGRIELLKVLIGADMSTVNIQDKKGSTAAMFAARNGHVDALQVLVNADRTTVNARNNEDGTAAMFAASYGHADVLDVLIKAGADLDVKMNTAEGETVAMIAEKRGHADVLRVLARAIIGIDA